MRKFVKCLAAAATIALAGCATAPHRQAETANAPSKSAAETMKACESAIYYTSEHDRQSVMNCANFLDIWQ